MKFHRLPAPLLGCSIAGIGLFSGFLAEIPRATAAEVGVSDSILDEAEPEVRAEKGFMSISDGTVALEGEVFARGRGVTLTARNATYNKSTQRIQAQGDVVIRFDAGGEARIWRGDSATYNFLTREVEADNFRLGQAPFFAIGRKLKATLPEPDSSPKAAGASPGIHPDLRAELTDAVVTTDDISQPSYRIRADKLTLAPGRKLSADGATLFGVNLPLLNLPNYTRHLDRHNNFWTLQPGYRNRFGPFVESEYHWFARTNVEAIAALDWRQRRGFAGGPGINYDFGKLGQGGGRFYYAHDDLPDLYANGLPVRTDRHLYQWQHSLTNNSGLTIHGLVNGQNDPLVVRDFYENQFRGNLQPKTFFEVNQAWPNWTLDLLAQPQLIQFYQTVERLPDLKLTGLLQQVGSTPLYYDSESSAAYLRLRPGLLGGPSYSGFRADTYQQITLPKNFFGWLNFVPRVGGRLTYYGEPDGDGQFTRDHTRAVFNTGAELNLKASRVWTEPRSKLLDVQGIRHIIVPSINYVYTPAPSPRPQELPQFDTEFLTPRLLPIEFPDYYAIDSIDSQNTLRVGLFNKLQTKRQTQVADLLNWNLFTDWRLRPRDTQSTFADFFSDLEFAPRSWFLVGSETRFDPNKREFAEANHRVTLQPNDTWHWTLGHRFLRDNYDTYGDGNNLFYSSIYYRMSQNWGVRTTHFFEARDGRLEQHAYSLYRDFRSWTGALTLRFRDQRVGGDDWGVTVNFSLKAFPRFQMGDDRDPIRRIFGGQVSGFQTRGGLL